MVFRCAIVCLFGLSTFFFPLWGWVGVVIGLVGVVIVVGLGLVVIGVGVGWGCDCGWVWVGDSLGNAVCVHR